MKTLARITVLVLVASVLTFSPPLETKVVPELVDATLAVAMPQTGAAVAASVADDPETGSDVSDVRRSEPTVAPLRFSMIGFRLPEGVDALKVRTADGDDLWSGWTELERISAEDGPDAGTPEAANDRSHRFTDPLWVGDAERFQVEFVAGPGAGDLTLDATFIDALGLSGEGASQRVRVPGAVAEASNGLAVVSRAEWGANESWRKGTPSVARNVTMTVVHHTGHAKGSVANSYSRTQAPALVRSFYSYHTRSLGWSDIGYNMLIDRFGTVYEGRAGGLENGVIGAHAGGYNTGSFGVSVIGNFLYEDASAAAYESLVDVIAWKSQLHGMDPLGTSSRTAGKTRLRTISGHRDMGTTSCPGLIANRLWWIRTKASERMAAYAPSATRFTDLPADSVHRASVLHLDDLGVMRGYSPTQFGPAHSLTRAQMSTIIARALNLAPVTPNGRFSDVSVATSHAGHIHAIAKAGIASGYSDGRFRPGAPVRRDQMATFIARALKLAQSQPSFQDISLGSPHRTSIGALQAAGIARGDAGYYGPGRSLRRDQAATFVSRALKYRG